MEYTTDKLAQLSGVSSRTLRYYDQLGLLKPKRIASNGYRIYGQKEVDLLQQILFYKRLNLPLEKIKEAIYAPDFNFSSALNAHKATLLAQQEEIARLLLTIDDTLAYHKGEKKMQDNEKFAALKAEKLAENEEKFGQEIRNKYGKETIEKSNEKFHNLSQADVEKMTALEETLWEQLEQVAKTVDYHGAAAKLAYQAHRDWLKFSWPTYTIEAHRGLVEMYLSDERFKKYYDQHGENFAQILHNVVFAQTDEG
ncbi:MerR family transcriptional regulator [Enterococcus timonensis]|uniref:MerR family transcriptional regulator n=1 Tax=Enterococcus timonensis TaxID=1852364 RepID=UPI0008D9CF28|nr:MerR family transcriptional regulator [Enterococcus timonensis]